MGRHTASHRRAGVRRLGPEEWQAYRDLRLRALREDPLAFGSTLREEEGFSSERWIARLSRGTPEAPSATWAAVDATGGFLGTIVAARVEGSFHIFGMWVAPERRGEGTGGRLLDAALRWMKEVSRGGTVVLDVNPRQTAAIALYESRGFRRTGKSTPLEHSPTERTVEMIRSLEPPR